MLKFKTERVTDTITRIDAFNTEQMYLIEGRERAALIDTGSGFGDLKGCVEELTQKPLIVLLTHGHTDHAMGAAQFEEVYMNHADDAVFAAHGEKAFRLHSIRMSPLWARLEKEYIPTDAVGRFHSLREGDSFDLGGVSIEMFACPGHTRGSLAMLLREERILLLGDSCNGLTFLFDDFSTGVREYQKSLETLKAKTDGSYDRILLSHTGGEPFVNMIDGNIQNCRDILSGNTDDQPFLWDGVQYKLAKAFSFKKGRLDGGVGDIVYSEATKNR